MSIEIEVVAAGPPGPRGYTGNTGPKGDKGDKGDTGDLANLDIGTVTTGSPAAAHIDGNLEDGYELDLTLPAVEDSTITVHSLVPGAVGHYDVRAFGAVGDGVTDDTAAIQAAITAAVAVGGTVLIPPGTYKISDALTVTGAVTITGTGTIHQVTAGKNGLTVTGDDVTIDGLTLLGRHATTTFSASECAISAAGASAAAPLERLTLRNLTIDKWGMYGTLLIFVTGFTVTGCTITATGYAAVLGVSVIDGLIADNRIDDVIAGSGGNGYGISLSREETDSLTTDPHCADIVVRGNLVSGVPAWEGIDTHGGLRIVVADNVVLGCLVGIAIGGSDNASQVETWGPKQITITGNVVDSQVDDGSAAAGISFTGSAASGEAATGSIVGNIIRRHGRQDSSINGAMYLRNTNGLVISGNLFEEPSMFGVCLYTDNTGFTITGNQFVDAWSAAEAGPAAIGVRANNNVGVIAGNQLCAGTKTATYKNVSGVYLTNGTTGVVINAGINDLSFTNLTAAAAAMRMKTDMVLAPYQIFAGGDNSHPGYSFTGDPDTGFFPVDANAIGVAVGGARTMRLIPEGIYLEDGRHIYTQYGTGTMFPPGADRKLGFWGATPVVQPAANADTSGASLTDLETEVNQLKALLRSIGLMAAS